MSDDAPTVYVVQQTLRNSARGMVPKYDLTPAALYGEIEFLLSSTANPQHPEPLIADLRRGLAGYGDRDYLLCVGNPSLIGIAAAIAAQRTAGRLRLLQWSRIESRYFPVDVDLTSEQ